MDIFAELESSIKDKKCEWLFPGGPAKIQFEAEIKDIIADDFFYSLHLKLKGAKGFRMKVERPVQIVKTDNEKLQRFDLWHNGALALSVGYLKNN
jgi:hypothetical protein